MKIVFASTLFLLLAACNGDIDRYGVQLDRSKMIEGADDNHNGIRDDLDRYIALKIPDSRQAKAAGQFVKTIQRSLLVNKEHAFKVRMVAIDNSQAISCIFEVFPEGVMGGGQTVSLMLQNIVVNTKNRREEYALYNEKLDGVVVPVHKGAACED